MRRQNQRNLFGTWGRKDEFQSGPSVLGERRGIQTTSSQQPPHLVCSLPLQHELWLGTQSFLSNGPPSKFPPIKLLQSPYNTQYTSYFRHFRWRISPTDKLLLKILFSKLLISVNKADSSNHVIIPLTLLLDQPFSLENSRTSPKPNVLCLFKPHFAFGVSWRKWLQISKNCNDCLVTHSISSPAYTLQKSPTRNKTNSTIPLLPKVEGRNKLPS